MKRRWHAIAAAFILAAVLIATGSAVIQAPAETGTCNASKDQAE